MTPLVEVALKETILYVFSSIATMTLLITVLAHVSTKVTVRRKIKEIEESDDFYCHPEIVPKFHFKKGIRGMYRTYEYSRSGVKHIFFRWFVIYCNVMVKLIVVLVILFLLWFSLTA